MKAEDYLRRFETEAAGYLVDELPNEYIPKFLAFLQSRPAMSDDEIDPFKVPKPKVDPNDPHLYVEEQK